jgi:hypothetical protein
MNSVAFVKELPVPSILSDAHKTILNAISSPVNHDFAGLAGALLGYVDILSTQVNVKGEMTLFRVKKIIKRMSNLCAGMSMINHMSATKTPFDAIESLDALSVFLNSLFNKFNKTIDLSLSIKLAYINASLDYFTCNLGYLLTYFLKHPSMAVFDPMTLKIQVQAIDDKLHITLIPTTSVITDDGWTATDENIKFFDHLAASIGGKIKLEDYDGVKYCALTVVIPMLTNSSQCKQVALIDDVQYQQVA